MTQTGYFQSKFGVFEITGSEKGIRSVKMKEVAYQEKEDIAPAIKDCQQQLATYFGGQRKQFDLKLDFSGYTDFNQSVWRELLKVPYGRTTTYLKIAENLDNPKAVRAVGLANKNNPIAIIVPCHRCIASNGKLQGYFYGLDMKRKLLELENPMSFAEQGRLF